MNNVATMLLGLAMVGYVLYVVARVLLVAFGWSDGTFAALTGHLVAAGVVVAVAILGHLVTAQERAQAGDGSTPSAQPAHVEAAEEEADAVAAAAPAEAPRARAEGYDERHDFLRIGPYRQSFRSWWYDSDGDEHEHGHVHGTLRFYEDGTVVGVRSAAMPMRELEDTFTLAGTWEADGNVLRLVLSKTRAVDDAITVELDAADRADMKYYGEIADDESIVRAGTWEGLIRANTIEIGRWQFTQVYPETLRIQGAEDDLQALAALLSDDPRVESTFVASGNYYIDGDTGPAWHVLEVTCYPPHGAALQARANAFLA